MDASSPAITTDTGRIPRCDRRIPGSFWSDFVERCLGKYSAPSVPSNMEENR
jgi:hypothetical protein